ncbi:ribosomal protein S18-alanine N-acetyltransferase [Ruminococcus sp.]|uniref:ribosomal protein S18-alanine N-acetyltransferase n=1 Tax=Ruminococcus sp. TaxID=41978 RepID=UPI0025E64D02|nr:ribosomal protein S18-alanine N-acetyltransferase [Ruminococcus sp.]MBQ8967054.1 ribosomal protein S18-alanine N-acetyltransferase [Ruminococcus sp.]
MLKIVPLSAENTAAAAELSAKCLKEAWSESTLAAQLKNPHDHTVIAYADGVAAGFLSVWCVAGEAEINNICVLPEYRRQGIAKTMLAHAAQELTEAGRWVLEVRESNAAAIALYESLGFQKAGLRKNFYDSPTENALIMAK